MVNLEPTRPSGGTTNEQSFPQCDSVFGSRSLMDEYEPLDRVIRSPSMAWTPSEP